MARKATAFRGVAIVANTLVYQRIMFFPATDTMGENLRLERLANKQGSASQASRMGEGRLCA